MTDASIQLSLSDLIALQAVSRGLQIMKPRTVSATHAGGFTSSFHGRGMDFEEVRIYQRGDDVRSIDWRVTARTGQPHTKIFHQERERPIFIVLDYSPSLFFGTRRELKSVTATKTAALIAWAAVNAGDRIGGIIATPERYVEHAPKGRKQGVLPLLKTLSVANDPRCENKNTTHLAGVLLRLQRIIRPGSLVFIISDFHRWEPNAEQQLVLLAQHNDIIGCFIYDALEKEPPPPNYYGITDGRQTQTMSTYSAEFREAYRQKFLLRHQHIQSLFTAQGAALCTLNTEDDLVKKMNQEIMRRG
jgi:uncharacterized protein (DUF58 family)